MIRCKKHGLQQICRTSPDLADSFWDNKSFDKEKIITIIIKYYGGDEKIAIDEGFLEKHNFTKKDEPSVLEEKYFDFFNELSPVCPICFKEYLNEIGFDDGYIG